MTGNKKVWHSPDLLGLSHYGFGVRSCRHQSRQNHRNHHRQRSRRHHRHQNGLDHRQDRHWQSLSHHQSHCRYQTLRYRHQSRYSGSSHRRCNLGYSCLSLAGSCRCRRRHVLGRVLIWLHTVLLGVGIFNDVVIGDVLNHGFPAITAKEHMAQALPATIPAATPAAVCIKPPKALGR